MGISIRTFITVPFIVLTLLPAGLVGTLAYRNSQAAVEELAETLMGQMSDRVRQRNHSGGHGRMRVSGSENPGLVWFELLRTPIGGLKPY
ncbi:MAG: hypothetical protein ACO331_05870 [Prochlorothrix sp.]